MFNNILKGIIVVLALLIILLVAFNIQLYLFCRQQKTQIDSIRDKQDVEAEFNSSKFKYQADQMNRLNKTLEDLRQEISGQKVTLASQQEALDQTKDSLLQEIGKRQHLSDENKDLQTSLVDIKAEVDAIAQEMKSWQKDYVAVLAQLEQKENDTQDEIKNFENSMTAYHIPELKAAVDSISAEINKTSNTTDSTTPHTTAATY